MSMETCVTVTPYSKLTHAQIQKIIDDYRTPTLSFRDVARRNGIGKDTIMMVIRANKIVPRGRHAPTFLRVPRTSARPGPGVHIDVALERAKLTLRKRGNVVYGAEVTDGQKSKGLFRLDGRLVTRQQVMEAAAR